MSKEGDKIADAALADMAGYDKFDGWFRNNFDCTTKGGSLLCEIKGERMKVQNSVRQASFNEDSKKDMVKAVIDNHKINKRAGISYDKETRTG